MRAASDPEDDGEMLPHYGRRRVGHRDRRRDPDPGERRRRSTPPEPQPPPEPDPEPPTTQGEARGRQRWQPAGQHSRHRDAEADHPSEQDRLHTDKPQADKD